MAKKKVVKSKKTKNVKKAPAKKPVKGGKVKAKVSKVAKKVKKTVKKVKETIVG